MIKKLISILALIGLATTGSAMAGDTSGCGLGKVVLDGKSGMIMNLLASTTNGTFGSQTFGITSGTSGCSADNVLMKEKEKEVFVAVNFDNLSKDMAMGQGQTLSAFASLMGCSVGDFSRMTQAKYDVLTQGSEAALLENVKKEIAVDPKLAAACGLS
ncbi:MAG: DUF3015 domain-containing protein [Deltaproteobacteria bacterium]|nr:DUF3015 domain-containing protein [Deltaproteobacteria bacterium]